MSKELVIDFWNTIDNQEWSYLNSFFSENAIITWYNSYIDHKPMEMNVEKFIEIQKSSDVLWSSILERIEVLDDKVITVTKNSASTKQYYIISFFELNLGKITRLDQYYGLIKEA